MKRDDDAFRERGQASKRAAAAGSARRSGGRITASYSFDARIVGNSAPHVEVVLITTAYVEAPSREAAIASLTKVVGKPYGSNSLPKFKDGAEVILGQGDHSITVGSNVWLSPVALGSGFPANDLIED